MDWQPIETAPLDGSMVMLYYKGVGICQGCYIDASNDKGETTGKKWFAGLTWGHAQYFGEPYLWKHLDSPSE